MFVKKKIVRVIDFVIKVSVNLKEKNEKKLLGESINFWY